MPLIKTGQVIGSLLGVELVKFARYRVKYKDRLKLIVWKYKTFEGILKNKQSFLGSEYLVFSKNKLIYTNMIVEITKLPLYG